MKKLPATVWYVLTLRCEEADRVGCVHARGGATKAERFGAWVHKLLCRSCRAAHRQVRAIDELLASSETDRSGHPAAEFGGGMPDEMKRRIAARLADTQRDKH